MVSNIYKAYMYTVGPFSERDLAGIIKFHPEEREPIKEVVTFYSWKLLLNYLNYDENISDTQFSLYKEILMQNLIEFQEEESMNNEDLFSSELCSNLISRAAVFKNMGAFDKAFIDLDNALEKSPNNNRVLELRAEIYEVLGEYQKALENWKKALEIEQASWDLDEDTQHSEVYLRLFNEHILTYKEYMELNILRCQEKLRGGN